MSARLNEFSKDEWRDVARLVRPDLTDDEFNALWVDFSALKQRRALH